MPIGLSSQFFPVRPRFGVGHDRAGASTPMLMAKSGHTSMAPLDGYARPSAKALARWQERNYPARRR